MRSELVVHQLMANAAGVTALVGARIYPGRMPQNTAMPAISYELVSGVDIPPITANAGGLLLKSRVQVTVLAKNYSDVKAAHEQIRKAVLFQSGTFTFTTPAVTVRVVGIMRDLVGPDTRDDDLGLYMQFVDFMVIHDEV